VEVGRAAVDRWFSSVLAEGQWSSGPHRIHYRFERTDRPEAVRGPDPFRGIPDTLDSKTPGITRWTVHTAGYGWTLGIPWVQVEPVVEVSLARAAAVGATAVSPEDLYGGPTLWSVVAALRLSLGGVPHRMGRYGATPPSAEPRTAHHE
jgi:hypothetical protein